MDFDHPTDTVKTGEISKLLGGRVKGMAFILAEIEKCDIVCANCHRIRSHKRTGRHEST
jgi:hypothetical protein